MAGAEPAGQRNALSADLLADLEAALQKMLADKAVRVVILAGSGGHFCAGQDLSERDPRQLDKMPDLEAVQKQLYHPILARIAEADKPVIAAVDGIAAGAGAGLALHCDLVLASRRRVSIWPLPRLGLAVDAGLGWHLGASWAARTAGLLMTGGSLSAEEAHAAGLVSQVCEGSAQEAAADLAAQLAAGPQQALAEIKLLCRQAEPSLILPPYLQAEAAGQGRAGAHPDYAEGVLAFLQKRAAEFG